MFVKKFGHLFELDHFELKFTWNHTDVCNLTSLFKNNSVSQACIDANDTLQISAEYLFENLNNTANFKPVHISLDLDMLLEIRESIEKPYKDVFLKWNTRDNSFDFIGTECELISNDIICANNINISQAYIFVKFTDYIYRSGFIINDKVSYFFNNGDLIIKNLDFEIESPNVRILAQNNQPVDVQIVGDKADVKHLRDIYNKTVDLNVFGYIELIDFLDTDKNAIIQLGNLKNI